MNNIKFKKSLMAAAAGVAMAAAGMSAASANTLLFPFFSTQGGASSFLMLRSGAITDTKNNVHFTWNLFADSNGNLLSGLNTSVPAQQCVHVDNYGTMTQNDVLFTEMSGPDPYADKSVPAVLPQGLNGGKPLAGFLVVSDTAVAGTATKDGTLTGQMIVADPNLGSVWAYNGIDGNGATAKDGDFSNIKAGTFYLSWYPQGGANVIQQTAWYALAVGDMSADISAQSNWAPKGGLTVSQPYNNDEVASYSGKQNPTIGCASVYSLQNLLTAAQYQQISGTGGQVNISYQPYTAVAPNTSVATGLVVVKADTAKLAANAPWGTPGGTTTVFTIENNLNPALTASAPAPVAAP